MVNPNIDAAHLTATRAARLFQLLTKLGEGPQPRPALLRRLKLDLRGFYRDLELLRSLGVSVSTVGSKYHLTDPIDAALARLPFPDPGLTYQDAVVLARGTTAAHKRLSERLKNLCPGHRSNRVKKTARRA